MVQKFAPLATDDAATTLRRMHWDEELSVLEMSKRFGCSRTAVTSAMRRCGIPWRTYSAAQFAKNRHLTPEQRKQYTEKAHAAVRGSRRPWSQKCRIAQTLQRTALDRLSKHELHLLALLHGHGLCPVALHAIGAYNADLAFPAVRLAVEVDGGHWHEASPRKIAQDARKESYLRSLNWRTVRVPARQICEAVAEQIASLVKVLEFLPPGPC